jgi:hypothetical protein
LFMSFRFAKGYKCFGALHLPKSVNHFQLSINHAKFAKEILRITNNSSEIWWLLKRNFRQLSLSLSATAPFGLAAESQRRIRNQRMLRKYTNYD